MSHHHGPLLVEDLMSTRPIHINENDPISLVVSLFERTQISGAPVINDKGQYVGVISKTDFVGAHFLGLIRSHMNPDLVTAKEMMNPNQVVVIEKSEPVEKAVTMMLDKHIHRVFATDDTGKIIGTLSSFDVLKAIQTNSKKYQAADAAEKANATEHANKSSSGGKGAANKKDEKSKNPNSAEQEEKEKEIERRIFNLISRKQSQMMDSKSGSGVKSPPQSG